MNPFHGPNNIRITLVNSLLAMLLAFTMGCTQQSAEEAAEEDLPPWFAAHIEQSKERYKQVSPLFVMLDTNLELTLAIKQVSDRDSAQKVIPIVDKLLLQLEDIKRDFPTMNAEIQQGAIEMLSLNKDSILEADIQLQEHPEAYEVLKPALDQLLETIQETLDSF